MSSAGLLIQGCGCCVESSGSSSSSKAMNDCDEWQFAQTYTVRITGDEETPDCQPGCVFSVLEEPNMDLWGDHTVNYDDPARQVCGSPGCFDLVCDSCWTDPNSGGVVRCDCLYGDVDFRLYVSLALAYCIGPPGAYRWIVSVSHNKCVDDFLSEEMETPVSPVGLEYTGSNGCATVEVLE